MDHCHAGSDPWYDYCSSPNDYCYNRPPEFGAKCHLHNTVGVMGVLPQDWTPAVSSGITRLRGLGHLPRKSALALNAL